MGYAAVTNGYQSFIKNMDDIDKGWWYKIPFK
jgi:hypothetical protein